MTQQRPRIDKKHRGAISTWVAVTCTAVIAGSVVVAATRPARRTDAQNPLFERPQSVLSWVGVSASALAAASVGPSEAETVLVNAADYLAEHREELAELFAANENAAASLAALASRIQTGEFNESDLANLDTVRTSAAVHASRLDAAREAVLLSATTHLSKPTLETLRRIIHNCRLGLNPMHAALELDEAGVVRLREALASEVQAQKAGEQVKGDIAELLTEARATPEFQAASTSSAASSQSIKNLWTTWRPE